MGVDVGGSNKAKSDPNVVPLCDILLVLLIIFMVITPAMQKGIDIKLPETAQEDTFTGTPGTTITLTIERDGSIKLNQDPIDLHFLEGRLRDIYQARQDKTAFIRADENTQYKEVLKIIDIAKGAGAEVLGVITERYKTYEETPDSEE